MTLHALKREYENRRQLLIDQLQKNPSLDPATQHQIYGAIKEIENFLKTIEYQIALQGDQTIPRPAGQQARPALLENTREAVYHVARGTKKVFTHHIPHAAKQAVAVPKAYFDRKREEARLRREIEEARRVRELQQLHTTHQQQLMLSSSTQAAEHVVLEYPHQELATKHEIPQQPLPVWTDDTMHKEPSQPVGTPILNDHLKRTKIIAKPSKSKARPSRHAKNKKGGMHKPHLKKDKYRKRSH